MKSKITERGQITIPKELRDRLGIRPGQFVDFTEDGGRLVISRRNPSDPVEAVYGILSVDRSTDDLMTELRDGEGR